MDIENKFLKDLNPIELNFFHNNSNHNLNTCNKCEIIQNTWLGLKWDIDHDLKGFTALFLSIDSRSTGEKSPSGPINIHIDLEFFKSSIFKISFEFTSANKSFEVSSKVFKKSFNFITFVISGGTS